MHDPERYCIVESDARGKTISLEEGSKSLKTNYAVTELHFHDQQVVDLTRNLNPFSRSDLKIADINRLYLQQGKLDMDIIGRSFAWLDTGTVESLLATSQIFIYLEKSPRFEGGLPKRNSLLSAVDRRRAA